MAQRSVSIVIEVAGTEDAVRQVRRMRSALDDLGTGGTGNMTRLLQQSREATQAMKEMQKSFQLGGQQKQMIADLDGFFARIVTGARTAGDVFKNVWKEVSDFFRRMVREMAAAGSLSLGSGLPLLAGGGAGVMGLTSALLGLGGGGSFGSSPWALNRTAPTLAATLGFPATTPFGDVLARLAGGGGRSGSQLLFGGMGVASLGVGSRNRMVSALGGFLGGGLTGLALGGGVLAGTALGAFAGPIGAVVGGLVGLLAGGGGKEKQHDAQLSDQGFAQLRQIKEDYEHYRRDYASTVDAMNRVWSQMAGQFVRSESARTQRPWFDIMLEQVRQIEDERNRRRQGMSVLPLPEFQEGGLVGGWPSQTSLTGAPRIPAFLHPGEFVMSSQAVERLGVNALEGMNRGGNRSQESAVSISLEPASAATLGEMLKRNPQALEEGLLVVLRRGGAASRALRG
ncbi:MAG: hypothetical protein HY649_09140 [Acidobacteria bacterium]|nr:hypothetical protein [Acidobacteriota bacterium]